MIEIKRGFTNRNIFLFLILGIAISVLGITLLVTIDDISIKSLTYRLCVESVYTVVTQFGTLLFSAIIIQSIANDYKEKTIYFYNKLGYTPLKYYINKVIVMTLLFSLTSFVSNLILSIIFQEYSIFLIVFLKILSVMILFIALSCFFSFIFDNFIKAFVANFVFWLVGNVFSASGGYAELFAYYDAANTDHKIFTTYLGGNSINIMNIIARGYIYDMVVFFICMILVYIMGRKWMTNGI